MIELVVEDYCQNCSDFEAKVDKISFGDFNMNNARFDTIIQCANYERCRRVMDYLIEVNNKGCFSHE